MYVMVNVAGLAIGLAACLLITGFALNELRFERCHEKHNRIYRIDGLYNYGDSQVSMANIMPAVGPAVRAEFSEVEEVVRLHHLWEVTFEFSPEDRITTDTVLAAEPSVFSVFTLPLISGNPKTALSEPLSMVVSRAVVRDHFGGVDPVGKTVRCDDSLLLTITGVMADIPANTQIRPEYMLSHATLPRMGFDVESWSELFQDYTYVLLTPGADPSVIENALPELIARHTEENSGVSYDLQMQPLDDIYLHSNLSYELHPNGDPESTYVVSAVAVLILLLACINFVNLTTARSTRRMKEVGVRKVMGARPGQLMKQFLTESVCMTILSMLLGIVLFELAKPQLEAFLNRRLAIDLFGDPMLLGAMLVMILIVGVLSGSYPAFVLSRFRPTTVLRGARSGGMSRPIVRRALVVFQLAVAVTLMCSTFAIKRQIEYSMYSDPGYVSKNILLIEFAEGTASDRRTLLADEIRTVPGVLAASHASEAPGEGRWSLYGLFLDEARVDGQKLANGMQVDCEFIPTLGLELVAGRNFSPDLSTDRSEALILNEAAVADFGLEEAIGSKIYRRNGAYTVIGVMKDFRSHSTHNAIAPCMLLMHGGDAREIVVRLADDDIAEATAGIADLWARHFPDEPMKHRFLEDIMRHTYDNEVKAETMFLAFSGLAILVACLGLFGLAAFTAERRIREIGIRKTLGASIGSIVTMLSREFALLVVVASVVAWPVAYWLIDTWLQDFAFRMDISWTIFVFAGATALLVALGTVSYQAARAAMTNPADVLRHE